MKSKATYLNRPMDFLLGTGYGQFTACMASWAILVLAGALAWVRRLNDLDKKKHNVTRKQWFAGGSQSLDLGLADDGFSDSIWASYIMFIDIGTQTGMKTTDEGLTLLIAVCISIVGFVFLLLVLGVIVDVVRKVLDFYESHHARVIANGHTVILGWSDKALFLLDEMVRVHVSTSEQSYSSNRIQAQMIISTKTSFGAVPQIVILCDEDFVDIITQIKITYGSMSGSESAYSSGRFFGELSGRHYLHGVEIIFWKGDRTDPYDLERISIFSAKHIVAIANPALSELEADQEVLRTILAIKVVELHSLGTSNHRRPRIITEMRLRDHEPVVQKLGGNSVNCLVPRITVNAVLALCTMLPTLGELFNKLLAFDDGNEVYELRLDRNPYDGLIGMNCRQVMNCIPDAIVIAVQRGWVDVKKWRKGETTVQPKYLVPYECHELRKEDRLIIITRELHEVELHVRSLGLATQYEKIKTQASKDTVIRREKSTELVTKQTSPKLKKLGKRLGSIAKHIDTSQNYSWIRTKRKIVIIGWASDLFDLLNTFLSISVVAWPGEDCLDVEVHILGGPKRHDARTRFWKQFTSLAKIETLEDETLKIAIRDEQKHGMVIFHYPGQNSRARFINTLPLSTARSILILSDDDNESALASDSQCLTNLMLVSELWKKQCRASKKRNEAMPSHLHVVCEILDPHTPKMVKVQPLRNPFLPCKNVHVDVTFFCTNMLETAMFALSCYNPLLTDFHKRTVRSIAGLRDAKNNNRSGALPKFKVIQIRSLFGDSDDDGVDSWPQTLSFNEIDQILCDSHRMILVGWQKINDEHHSEDVEIIINPLDKNIPHSFSGIDLLLVL